MQLILLSCSAVYASSQVCAVEHGSGTQKDGLAQSPCATAEVLTMAALGVTRDTVCKRGIVCAERSCVRAHGQCLYL